MDRVLIILLPLASYSTFFLVLSIEISTQIILVWEGYITSFFVSLKKLSFYKEYIDLHCIRLPCLALNFVFQVAGGCWYILAIQRVASCIRRQCEMDKTCSLVTLSCSKGVCYGLPLPLDVGKYSCDKNMTTTSNIPVCLDSNGSFPYGIYQLALPVVSSNSLVVKILYPIFWGLMTLR